METTTEVPVKKSNGLENGGGSPSDSGGSSGEGEGREKNVFEYSGWVHHLGTNSIGHEYCHSRFLFTRGRHGILYKRDPHENPGIKPIRKGVVGPTFMVEELGRRKVNRGDVYVIKFDNRLDETKKGEIVCATAGGARKWLEAFDHAKQQAEYEFLRGGGTRNKLNIDNEKDHPRKLLHFLTFLFNSWWDQSRWTSTQGEALCSRTKKTNKDRTRPGVTFTAVFNLGYKHQI